MNWQLINLVVTWLNCGVAIGLFLAMDHYTGGE